VTNPIIGAVGRVARPGPASSPSQFKTDARRGEGPGDWARACTLTAVLDLARQAFKLPVPKTSTRGANMPAYLVAGVELTNRTGFEPFGARRSAYPRHRQRSARRACDRIRLGPGQPGLGQAPGHSYGGYAESGIGREFSLEDMLDSFTQPQERNGQI
jgi:hypothetical protein